MYSAHCTLGSVFDTLPLRRSNEVWAGLAALKVDNGQEVIVSAPAWALWLACGQCWPRVVRLNGCMQCVIDGQSSLAVFCACYGLGLALALLYVGLVSAHLSPLCGGVAPAV